jgi:hypothetical protein
MTQSAVQWLEKHITDSYYKEFIEQAKEMEKKQKLEKQLFIGKVSEIIGFDKTVELLRESKQAIEEI